MLPFGYQSRDALPELDIVNTTNGGQVELFAARTRRVDY